MPRAGDYRHLVTIEAPVETTDSFGQAIKSWSTFATPYAAIEPLRGREFFASAQISAEITVRIRMRYLPGVTEKMRVVHNGKYYNIISPPINPNERNRELHLMCGEGLNAG
jgi:SPP1 family predicted phage head-tail adaptor